MLIVLGGCFLLFTVGCNYTQTDKCSSVVGSIFRPRHLWLWSNVPRLSQATSRKTLQGNNAIYLTLSPVPKEDQLYQDKAFCWSFPFCPLNFLCSRQAGWVSEVGRTVAGLEQIVYFPLLVIMHDLLCLFLFLFFSVNWDFPFMLCWASALLTVADAAFWVMFQWQRLLAFSDPCRSAGSWKQQAKLNCVRALDIPIIPMQKEPDGQAEPLGVLWGRLTCVRSVIHPPCLYAASSSIFCTLPRISLHYTYLSVSLDKDVFSFPSGKPLAVSFSC